jgi:hypothetical protein
MTVTSTYEMGDPGDIMAKGKPTTSSPHSTGQDGGPAFADSRMQYSLLF